MSRAVARSKPSYALASLLCLASAISYDISVNYEKNRAFFDAATAEAKTLVNWAFEGDWFGRMTHSSGPGLGRAYASTIKAYDRLAHDGAFYNQVQNLARNLGNRTALLPWDKDGDGKYLQIFREPYWALKRYFNEMYAPEAPTALMDLDGVRLPERLPAPDFTVDGSTTTIAEAPHENGDFNLCYYWITAGYACSPYPQRPGEGGGPVVHKPPSAAPEPSFWALGIVSIAGTGIALRTRRRNRIAEKSARQPVG